MKDSHKCIYLGEVSGEITYTTDAEFDIHEVFKKHQFSLYFSVNFSWNFGQITDYRDKKKLRLHLVLWPHFYR